MKITLDLPDDQAMALAQLAKRLGYDDAERLSSRYDGGEERDAMLAGQATARSCRGRLCAAMTTTRPTLSPGPAFLHGQTRHTH
jgi:hypothetical protein